VGNRHLNYITFTAYVLLRSEIPSGMCA